MVDEDEGLVYRRVVNDPDENNVYVLFQTGKIRVTYVGTFPSIVLWPINEILTLLFSGLIVNV